MREARYLARSKGDPARDVGRRSLKEYLADGGRRLEDLQSGEARAMMTS